MGHGDFDVLEAVFLGERGKRFDRVAAIAGIVIDGGDLLALQLVVAAKLLGDVVDDDRRFRPVVEQKRELIRKDRAVDRIFASARVRHERHLVGADFLRGRDVEAARRAHEDGDRRAVVAVFVALVAFEPALERVGRLAFLDEDL